MLNKILKSKFKGNNANVISEVLKGMNKPDSQGYVWTRAPLPDFMFYSKKDIPAGHYDFEVRGLIFESCWLEPFKVYTGRIYYKSGSYCVRTK